MLFSGSEDKTIKVWNLACKSCIFSMKGHTDYVNKLLLFSPEVLCSGSLDSSIRFWNVETGQLIHTLKEESVFDIILLKDNTLASVGDDQNIRIW